ncbi:MAG: hypothetical protein KTR25_00065 [Myxococcales bacterium]|nr:hypothetical protein [Myxococcales bacterium]
MRISRLGLTVALGVSIWNTSASAKAVEPTMYIPAHAPLVMVIRSPLTALNRLDTIGRAAGIISPSEEGNFILKQVHTIVPELGDHVDLSQPIWAAALVTDLAVQKSVPVVIILKSKGKGLPKIPKMANMELRSESGWLIATTPGTTEFKAHKNHFSPPSEIEEIKARGDIILYTRAHDIALNQGDADKHLAEVLSPLIDGTTITGISLAENGLEILSQSLVDSQEHRKVIADLAQAERKRQTRPILTGLPSSNYLFITGFDTDTQASRKYLSYVAEHSLSLFTEFVNRMINASDPTADGPHSATDHAHDSNRQKLIKITELAERTLAVIFDPPALDCPRMTIGVQANTASEAITLESAISCENTKQLAGRTEEQAKALTAIFRSALDVVSPKKSPSNHANPVTTTPDFRIDFAKKTSTRYEIKLLSKELDLPQQANHPLVLSILSKKQASLSYGIQPQQQKALDAAATQDKAIELTAPKVLLKHRNSESYFQPWSLVVDFLPKEMGMLGPLLQLLPPITLATRNELDGSLVVQMWVPEKILQAGILAGSAAAMQQ